jgi:hypothetical protein
MTFYSRQAVLSLISVKKRDLLSSKRALSMVFQIKRALELKKKVWEIRPTFLGLGVYGLLL